MKINFLIVFITLIFDVNANQEKICFFDNINKNKEEVEIIFNQLFKLEPFAYTLYFDKPMTFSDSIMDSDDIENELNYLRIEEIDEYVKSTINSCMPSKKVLKKACKTLQTNQLFINNKKYLFAIKKFNGYDAIVLINKQNFNEKVREHINIFKEIFGDNFSPELLLSQIEMPNADIKKILKDNHVLLGILLGFGKYNAQLFQIREELYSKLDSLNYLKDYKKKVSIQKKIDRLWEKLQCRNDYYTYSLIAQHQVGYVCDRSHSESIELEKKYEKQSKEINEIINKENWIENILLKLNCKI